jgi:Calcium binding
MPSYAAKRFYTVSVLHVIGRSENACRVAIDGKFDVSHPGSKETVTEMRKRKRDSIREKRIQNEVVVDAYGPEEQALGWYYYLEDNIRFPFQAKCILAKAVSPLLKGETVKVRRMAPEDACARDMLVLITWHGRSMAIPLSQLTSLDADESTAEAIGDWHYWVAQGYCF